MGRLTSRFVEALANVRSESLAAAEGGREAFQLENDIAQRWLNRSRWPPSMRVGGLAMRIFTWSVEGETAMAKGLGIFLWEGPAVPEYVIAHGTGLESYETFRKSKGK